MAGIFDKLGLAAFRAGITPRTDESRAWFRKKAQEMRQINRTKLMKEAPLERKVELSWVRCICSSMTQS